MVVPVCYIKEMRNSDVFIMSVTMMDFITALFILAYPKPLLVARLGIFYQTFPSPYVGAFLMLSAVIAAAMGLMVRPNHPLRFILFMPQHFFLLLTTGSAIDYIIMQHYADGVTRSWEFIFQDQLPIIVLTLGYAFAILDFRKIYARRKLK